jgi:hypothetical protein
VQQRRLDAAMRSMRVLDIDDDAVERTPREEDDHDV